MDQYTHDTTYPYFEMYLHNGEIWHFTSKLSTVREIRALANRYGFLEFVREPNEAEPTSYVMAPHIVSITRLRGLSQWVDTLPMLIDSNCQPVSSFCQPVTAYSPAAVQAREDRAFGPITIEG